MEKKIKRCLDCNKIITGFYSKRCFPCSHKYVQKNHLNPGNYKDGRTLNRKCIDCGKNISKSGTRCKPCLSLFYKKEHEKNKDKIEKHQKEYRKQYKLKHRKEIRIKGRIYSKEYRKKNPEKIRMNNLKYNRPWRAKHKKYCKEYYKKYQEKHRERLKKVCAEYRKNNQDKIKICKIRCNFKITQKEAEKLFKRVHGVCDICKKSETCKSHHGNIMLLSVDHDHKTGKIRGVLCSKCNKALGGFGNNIKILKLAIKYLRKNG